MYSFWLQHPIYLLFWICFILWYFFRSSKQHKRWVDTVFFQPIKSSYQGINYTHLLSLCVWSILLLFGILFSAPYTRNNVDATSVAWIDIVFVLDLSSSMLADDFTPNRLEVAKQVIDEFVEKLETDRVWFVVYAWKAFTSLPLTFDYDFIREFVNKIDIYTINQQVKSLQGTATGEWLLAAVRMLESSRDRASQQRQQAIILLTDGEVTPWTLDPILSAKLAAEWNIKIYSIWIWSDAWWSFMYQWPLRQEKIFAPWLNDEHLKKISTITNSTYRRASDENRFREIFEEISNITKHELILFVEKNETYYYYPFIFLLSLLLILYLLIKKYFTS